MTTLTRLMDAQERASPVECGIVGLIVAVMLAAVLLG